MSRFLILLILLILSKILRWPCPQGKARLVRELNRHERFEALVLPHLDAAYNLARWLTRSEFDAGDVVQEACLRAYAALDSFVGHDARPWLLTIVRNCAYSWLRKYRVHECDTPLDDGPDEPADPGADPAQILARRADAEAVHRALDQLPVEFREVILLREMEGLGYREIAEVSGVPIGTVMSRLARARTKLGKILREDPTFEGGQL